jgi:acyl-coenzyme A thioesterase PaaI-like protein
MTADASDAPMPDVSLKSASRFVAAAGLVVEEVTTTSVRGFAELDENHHTPWGVVHGGVYTTIVESAGSIGASHAVTERISRRAFLRILPVDVVGSSSTNSTPAGAL